MNPSVHQHKQALDALFEKIDAVDDLELQGQWARYLCVRTSGFIEEAVRIILSEYADKRAGDAVARYVAARLDRFTTANKNNIGEELTRFNPEWATRFNTHVVDNLQGSLNSVISNRHRIAHGRDVGLSYARMKDYYEDVVEVVALLDDICDGD